AASVGVGFNTRPPGFSPRQDIRTPVTIAVIFLALTQAMNAVFVPFLGHAGLALSVSLGATINAVWLFVGLKRGGWYQPAPGWGRLARETLRVAWLAASLVGAAVVYFGVLLAAGMRPRDFSRRV